MERWMPAVASQAARLWPFPVLQLLDPRTWQTASYTNPTTGGSVR